MPRSSKEHSHESAEFHHSLQRSTKPRKKLRRDYQTCAAGGRVKFEGYTEKLGDEFTYQYKDVHCSKQKLTEVIPGKKVSGKLWTAT